MDFALAAKRCIDASPMGSFVVIGIFREVAIIIHLDRLKNTLCL